MASEKKMTIKGSGVLATPQFVKKKFPERYDAWIESLPPESKAIHNRAVLASDWYPLNEALIIPTKKICDLFYGGNERGAWETGKFSADDLLGEIFSHFCIGK